MEMRGSVKLANSVTFDRYVFLLTTSVLTCPPIEWIEQRIRCQEFSLGQ